MNNIEKMIRELYPKEDVKINIFSIEKNTREYADLMFAFRDGYFSIREYGVAELAPDEYDANIKAFAIISKERGPYEINVADSITKEDVQKLHLRILEKEERLRSGIY